MKTPDPDNRLPVRSPAAELVRRISPELEPEAFLEVAGSNTRRVKALDKHERLFYDLGRRLGGLLEFIDRDREITLLVYITDNNFCNSSHIILIPAMSKLHDEMIIKVRGSA